MDLLDDFGQKVGNEKRTYRTDGPAIKGWKAQALLLARLPASLSQARIRPKAF